MIINDNNIDIDFVAVDFETATRDRHSPCEIGLTFVKNGKITDTMSWLIKPFSYPYFDSFNVYIHGIYPRDVANQPEFPELWIKIKPLIENKFMIAHNAGFDFSVLRKTLEYYNLPIPDIKYACSYRISKKVWEGLSAYDLKSLCNRHQINFIHHRAGGDSRACAELTLVALRKLEVASYEDIKSKAKIKVHELLKKV